MIVLSYGSQCSRVHAFQSRYEDPLDGAQITQDLWSNGVGRLHHVCGCRRRNRELKAYSKQVQAEKQKERIRAKKEQIGEMTALRKQRVKSGFEGALEFDKDFHARRAITPDKAGQRIRAGAKALLSFHFPF